MSATPQVPLLKRVSPPYWAAVVWTAALAYSVLRVIPLPGEAPKGDHRFVVAFPLVILLVATAVTVRGSALLRRRPMPAFALFLLGAVIGTLELNSSMIGFAQIAAAVVALGLVADAEPRRTSLSALALTLAVLTVYTVQRIIFGWPIETSTGISVALTAVVAWFVGDSTRQSRVHLDNLATQATAQAATSERLRIARELHDMVAHSVAVIALQAGAVNMLIDVEPTKARQAAAAIESSSRETLSGLRRMLVALRDQDSDAEGSGPMPGLADLDRLAASTGAAGVRVDVAWQGERRTLPAEIELSAFRIIQESVTNVVRHAGTDACRVSVACHERYLAIEIVDDGVGPGIGHHHLGSGYGLVGVRERVALLRGEFAAGPRPEGGFRVAARLPLLGTEG